MKNVSRSEYCLNAQYPSFRIFSQASSIYRCLISYHFIAIHHKTVQQICDLKETVSEKWFSENNWWWWLRDRRRDRGRDERNLGWQGETREEQDPTRWGAWEAVCSAAWLTCNCRATARAPPRLWRNRAQYAPTVSRQIHLFRHRKWRVEIHRKTETHTGFQWGREVRYSSTVMWELFLSQRQVSRVSTVCFYPSAARESS